MKLCFPTLREANAFVAAHHRHGGPTRGHRLSLGLVADELLGVAILGRPVSQELQRDRGVAEVLRVCVPELPGVIDSQDRSHANSMCSRLYAACWRVWSVGGHRLITYALESESGSSLRGAGFVRTAKVQPRPDGWSREGRERENAAIYAEPKWRWERNA